MGHLSEISLLSETQYEANNGHHRRLEQDKPVKCVDNFIEFNIFKFHIVK